MTAAKSTDSTQGLAGIIAGDSAICLCGATDETLLYRGYSIQDLCKYSSFEEVVWLLLNEKLPTKQELHNYKDNLREHYSIPQQVKATLEIIPGKTHPMDVLRTAVSLLGNLEPEDKSATIAHLAERTIAFLPSALLYWWNFTQHGARTNENTTEKSIAGQFLKLLYGSEPTDEQRRALDIALILYAEHEFNASTFTARTITSTLPDYYSAVVGAIGALRGPLHGGANEWAMDLLEECVNPDHAEKVIREKLANKQLVMGFGHRVYKNGDPRSDIIKEWARKLCESERRMELFEIGERIEKVMFDEKHLKPNLDFYSAIVFHCLHIPTPLFTPIFVISRTSGWSAHIAEQRAHNKLIRPLSHYTGPEHQTFIPVDKRS